MNTTFTPIIKELGLTDEEAQIYLKLLSLGGSQASIIAKELGIKRTTIYPILKNMADRGFITVYFRKNKRLFYAQKPVRVASVYHKKIEAFEQLIPALATLEKQEAARIGIRFIETQQELNNFYLSILEEYKGKQYDAIGNTSAWELAGGDFLPKFRHLRAKNKIKTRLLLTADSKLVNPTDQPLLRTWKYLPEKYKFKSTMDIFDDRVLIVSPNTAALAIVIAVPTMVDIFKSVFEILWDLFPEEK